MKVSRSNLISRLNTKSTRPKKYQKTADKELLLRIKEIVKERPAYGYRRVTSLLKRKLKSLGLPQVNSKRVYRVMKDADLLLEKPQKRPKRAHTGKIETFASNVRWCSDGFSIQCWNGDQVHVAFSLDCCDREVMRYIASTVGIDGQAIRDLMLETIEYRFGGPQIPSGNVQWLSDNGSCYVARETVHFGRGLGLDIRTTPVRSPESNGMSESFVKTFKRDYVVFGDLKDAQTVMDQLPTWFEDYNEKAPHKALKMLSPREFRKILKRAG
jgi:transposase InsO family protein